MHAPHNSINPPSRHSSSQTGELPVIKKTIELYKTYYGYLEKFDKKDRHALGVTCERHLISFIEFLLEARYLPQMHKRSTLIKTNNRLETLKMLIRILKELKIIDYTKYVNLQQYLQEIGGMLGNWIKSIPMQDE